MQDVDDDDVEKTAIESEYAAEFFGCPGLARLMMRLRKACPYAKGTPEHEVFLEQAYANVPLLILGCDLLHEHCQKTNRKAVLFMTRDGCVWQPLFEKLYPQYTVHKLVASRRLFSEARPEYVNYFRSLYDDETSVLVDLYGSGKHLNGFTEKCLGIEYAHVFVFNNANYVERPRPKRAGVLTREHCCSFMEDLSADVVGCYVDLVDGNWINAENEHPAWLAAVVARARDLALEISPLMPKDITTAEERTWLVWRLLTPVKENCRILKYFAHVMFH